jgi:hypothetical protein
LFSIAVSTELGNGNNTLFSSDRWLHGCSLENLAPEVFDFLLVCLLESVKDKQWLRLLTIINGFLQFVGDCLGLESEFFAALGLHPGLSA